jgi:hypothetical protein
MKLITRLFLVLLSKKYYQSREKDVPVHAINGYIYTNFYSRLYIVRDHIQAPTALTLEMGPCTHCTSSWAELRTALDIVKNRKICFSVRGLHPGIDKTTAYCSLFTKTIICC